MISFTPDFRELQSGLPQNSLTGFNTPPTKANLTSLFDIQCSKFGIIHEEQLQPNLGKDTFYRSTLNA
jgi:hypothetical protein